MAPRSGPAWGWSRTHYMDEAEHLCDRLVVMDHGTIAAEGTPRELITRYSTPEVLELPEAEETSDRPVEPRVRSTSDAFDFSSVPGRRGLRLIERHARFSRRMWLVVASGAAEPLFYLLSVGSASAG
jgi:ABC-type multidrug transport system ATPase subunit